MKKRAFFLLWSCLLGATAYGQSNRIDLSGPWHCALDSTRSLTAESPLTTPIQLPGTLGEAGLGKESTASDFGILTLRHKYRGVAWYGRWIDIPQAWKGRELYVELERVMWQSTLYVDGKKVSTQDALGSPHVHPIGVLSPGRHRLVLAVDNSQIHNIGDKGHAYTDYTQSIWNGVVGRLELVARSSAGFGNPRIAASANPCVLEVRDTLYTAPGIKGTWQLVARLRDRATGHLVWQTSVAQRSDRPISLCDTMPSSVRPWDDIHPNLYTLELVLQNRDKVFERRTYDIGFRTVSNQGNQLMVNGRRVFLRGNLDCVHFPLTGYPSCRVEDWEAIFRTYKAYGLNHVRFHSWTPPAAAFAAADRVGIYIQSEVVWLDWWMAIEQTDRPEMFTPGLPKGLGDNPSADAYVQAELRRMVDRYGNHPSFAMMCIGNELGNSDFGVMESWIKPYKEQDNRRIYASSTARRINPSDQYMATHSLEGVGATRGLRGGASLDWDFENVYSKASIPIIAHEIGQWPVYPRWSEIKKYQGTLRAMNFEEFAAQAKKNGIYDQNEAFVEASGALNQIMYKYEIESFLRTPSCSGIQLLSMQDYQGQGEALIGWLDAFWQSKGITTPERFRRHHDSVVLLLRLPKFVYRTGEPLVADVQLAQWGDGAVEDAIEWRVEDEQHRVVASGTLPKARYERATSAVVGQIAASLQSVDRPSKLTVTLAMASRPIENSWSVWVYPELKKTDTPNVYQTNRFDSRAQKVLAEGGRVLLDASGLGDEQSADPISFYPLYWSLTFFPGQGKNTIGLVVDDRHPALAHFATDAHSDWQWQSIYKNARAFYLNGFPSTYRPIAQPVDDFHRNNFLGSIFELQVGPGKLLVSGFALGDTTNIVAGQLRQSILQYMASDAFAPTYGVEPTLLDSMFRYVEPLQTQLPDGFSSASLYVDAQQGQRHAATGYGYVLGPEGWAAKNTSLRINLPKGMIGALYLCVQDPDKEGRRAAIDFEGRHYKLDKIDPDGSWVKIEVMREDSNKGYIDLSLRATRGSDVRLGAFAVVAQ